MKLFALGLPIIIFATYGFFVDKAITAANKNNNVLTYENFVKELQPITPAGAQKYN